MEHRRTRTTIKSDFSLIKEGKKSFISVGDLIWVENCEKKVFQDPEEQPYYLVNFIF